MDKFKRAILIAVCIVVFIAYMDARGFQVWQAIGEGDFTEGWRSYVGFFFAFTYGLIALLALAYYFLFKPDLSETVAVAGTSYILWSGGLADILYFVFLKQPIPARLDWLDTHWFMGTVSGGVVTKGTLFLSTAISIVIVYLLVKYLRRAKW